jgi:transposase
VFKAKSVSGDYHGSMDEHNFTKWFTEQRLPNIPDNAVIIMDNASYHNTYKEDGVPPLTSKKIVLQAWLSENNIVYGEDFLRPPLIELINSHRPPRLYKLNDMLRNDPNDKSRGIEILRTPQYHPERQPIEKCWAVVKQYRARHGDFTLKGLQKNLEEAWSKVTAGTMKGGYRKSDVLAGSPF